MTARRISPLIISLVVVLLAGCGVDEPTVAVANDPVEEGEPTPVAPVPTEPVTDDTSAVTDTQNSSTSTAASTGEQPSTSDASTTTTTPTSSTPETATTTSTTPSTTIEAPAEISSVALDQVSLDIELVATLSQPIGLAPRPGTTDLFVIEQAGRIVRLPNGAADGADTTLDLRGELSGGNEQGLLGLTFDGSGNRLYVNFTDQAGTTNIVRYAMAGNAADLASAETLLTIEQPQGNHNGGHLAFGPDGYLYIGMGDGGGGGDPLEHGQNPNTLHGAVLRIDVDTDAGYEIPPDNPFPNGGAPEVFVWGIRNAWRFGFDALTGDLWIGDVGQNRFEEVTVLRAASGGGNGANLGWNLFEADESFRGSGAPDGHVEPVIAYAHTNGRCSITGGEVYRASGIAELYGTYLYGDFCTGETFGYRVDEGATPARLDLPIISGLASFGLDLEGNAYALSRNGGVYRIVAG